MNKKLFTLLPLLALGLVACGEKPEPGPAPKPDQGSAEQPLTVAELMAKDEIKELEDKGTTEEVYYVTGITKSATCDPSYGSFTVYLGDASDEDLEFQLYSLKAVDTLVVEGTDDQGTWTYKATSAVKNASFVACGKVYRYGTTYELHYQYEGKIVDIKNATKVYYDPNGKGMKEENAMTFAEALAEAKKLDRGETCDFAYWFKAKVVEVTGQPSKSYDNCTVTVNGTGKKTDESISLYRIYFNGHKKTDEFISWFKANVTAGKDVIIKAQLMNHDGKLETKSSGDFWLLGEDGAKTGFKPAN